MDPRMSRWVLRIDPELSGEPICSRSQPPDFAAGAAEPSAQPQRPAGAEEAHDHPQDGHLRHDQNHAGEADHSTTQVTAPHMVPVSMSCLSLPFFLMVLSASGGPAS
jgi:hypothetical protein